MKKMLIATHNPAKLGEIIKYLQQFDKHFQIVSLTDLKIDTEPEETGKTFSENSLLKAKYYAHLANLPTISDDGGLIIPYLNDAPGVLSRRWPGYDASDQELIDYTLYHLRGETRSDRTAYLQTCITFFDPKIEKYLQETEKIKGHIAEKTSSHATNGYPYRALFVVDKLNKYYDELTEKEHDKINHRRKALMRLVEKIKNYMLK